MKKNFGVAAWLMAGKTMVLKDANDFFGEADLGSNRFVRARWVSYEQNEKEAQQAQNRKKSI
jgi:hypothetical protein